MQSNNEIYRFVLAHNGESETISYETAKSEINRGHKTTHWIWYILPQLRALGASEKAKKYGIKDIHEACEYLENEFLFGHYDELTSIIKQQLDYIPVEKLMGTEIDARKLVASLTLFRGASHLKFESTHEQKYQTLATTCHTILQKINLKLENKKKYLPCTQTLSVLAEYEAQCPEHALDTSVQSTLLRDDKPPFIDQQVETIINALDTYIMLRHKEPDCFYQGLFKGYKKIDKIRAAFTLRVQLRDLTEEDKVLKDILVRHDLKKHQLLKRDTTKDFAILDQGRLGSALRKIAKSEAPHSWHKSIGDNPKYPRTVIGMIQYFLDILVQLPKANLRK